MKTAIPRVPCLLLLCFAAASAQELVELPVPESNKLVVKVMFRNGSITDPAGKEGLTYATASLMAQGGAGGKSYAEIQDRLYPWAATYGVKVDKEVTVFTFQVPKAFADPFYPILRDVILKPALDTNDFKRVKINQQNYVDQVIRASSDETYSKQALEDLLFRGTNYQHMKQGTSDGVKSITLDDVKAHYGRFFTRHNVTVGIAGAYAQAYAQRLSRDMATLSDLRPTLPAPGPANKPKGIEVEIIAKEGAFGSAVFTGAPLNITRAQDEFAALMVANSWMGEHRKSYSRLYQKIRETRSMNYGDYAYIEWYDSGGSFQLPPSGVPRQSNYFSIWIRPVQIAKQLREQYPELADIKIGHAHFALRLALREFDLLIEKGMTPDAFTETRTFLRSYIKLYAQSLDAQLGWRMDSLFYGRQDWLSQLDGLLAKVTLDDVNKALRKHWQTENMAVTIVTDSSEAEALAESLRSNADSPMAYSNQMKAGLPETVLAEDRVVASYQLNVKSVRVIKSEETFQSSRDQ